MNKNTNLLGLDIGGANLKAAHVSGAARLQPFELWKTPDKLTTALEGLIGAMPEANTLAITMTGELCDCFGTRREGVRFILNAVEAVAGKRQVLVWRTEGDLVDLARAREKPLLVAAANWLALAVYAGRHAPHGPALLIDIGSTTTDIVPLLDGLPVPEARTDPDRLRTGELIYLGVRRTPLCALLHDGHTAELFATTLDAFLVLGIAENEKDRATADGRPATRAAAEARLARMIGSDLETSTPQDRRAMAVAAQNTLIQRLASGVEKVSRRLPGKIQTILASGSGEFLARVVVEKQTAFSGLTPIISLAKKLGPDISSAACAYAVAIHAAER